ncbi:MAG: molybdopterin molybdotransferase MoeA [Gemmatimonadetes bacterium]|nr:molybdopterin molybdotransferase MoeA [Gemmatimonadota bacterium]
METPSSAVAKILEHIDPRPVEPVSVAEALDFVLAEDISSPIDLPPWDNSAMDGYAVRSGDLPPDPPAELEIIEEIPAGAFPQSPLGAGQCARIFTGAPVPEGADGVIRQEDTTRLDETRVRIDDLRDAGRHIRFAGEDVRKGDVVLAAGSVIGPAAQGLLASIAALDVPVHGKPVVAILGSGDEIAAVHERDAVLEGRKIASSNTYTLVSLVRRAGGIPRDLGIAKDDPDELRHRLLEAAGADLVLTTGGISVGEHDFLHEVLRALDVDQKFWKIRMRPGAPVAFGLIGQLDGLPWLGLPGNPVSTMVTFELLARPAIRKMLGHSKLFRAVTNVSVGEPISLGPPLQHFLRVTLSGENATPAARLTGSQGSGLLTSMVRADALLVVPEDRPEVQTGEVLQAIVLEDHRHVAECPW